MYFQPETLIDMLTSFRKNNLLNHITGMMLFSEGSFLQVLEGPDKELDALVKKIKKDSRHHSLVQIVSDTIQERIFSDWKMSFKINSPEAVKNLAGYVDPWDPDFLAGLRSEQHPALSILKAFAQNSRMI